MSKVGKLYWMTVTLNVKHMQCLSLNMHIWVNNTVNLLYFCWAYNDVVECCPLGIHQVVQCIGLSKNIRIMVINIALSRIVMQPLCDNKSIFIFQVMVHIYVWGSVSCEDIRSCSCPTGFSSMAKITWC